MKNKPNLFVTLTIIYLALLALCLAIYAILQIYVKEIDRGTATNLMIWSATLFPSIALLYTFRSWREQKCSDVLAEQSKLIYNFIHENHLLFGRLNKINNVDKNMLHDEVKANYRANIQNLNIYHGILVHLKNDNTIKILGEYTDLLKEVFDRTEFNNYLFTKHQERLKKLGDSLNYQLINFILHNHQASEIV
jgi:hypothetical protein